MRRRWSSCWGEARSLVDTLWDYERGALPLTTPEAKAGLKARLLVHVEAIGEPDIRALYRRDLLERYSAYAFPKREPPEWQPAKKDWRGGKRTPAPERSSPDSLRRLRHATGGGGAREALSSAIVAGLIRHPAEIARHADMLARAPALDPRFDVLLDVCDAGLPLESEALATIFTERGFAVPGPNDYARMPYPFLKEDTDPALASDTLAAAIAMLVEEPAIDAAISAATDRFDLAEQQRLRERKRELTGNLRVFTSVTRASDDNS